MIRGETSGADVVATVLEERNRIKEVQFENVAEVGGKIRLSVSNAGRTRLVLPNGRLIKPDRFLEAEAVDESPT